MILLLDTSTPVCKISLVNGELRHDDQWHADRTLARHLLRFVADFLQTHGATWSDINGIGVYQGPGSFTGLRIGLTVMNTLADSEGIAIVGSHSDTWQDDVLAQLRAGDNHKIVMPHYGSEARITTPRK